MMKTNSRKKINKTATISLENCTQTQLNTNTHKQTNFLPRNPLKCTLNDKQKENKDIAPKHCHEYKENEKRATTLTALNQKKKRKQSAIFFPNANKSKHTNKHNRQDRAK